MPQEHYVLKCLTCETFQAHIVKKTKKWECKICGTKQSLKRNYGMGNGKDCRIQVMRLNELRLTMSDSLNSVKSEIINQTNTEDIDDQEVKEHLQVEKPLTSKWAKYLEENTPDKESESDDWATDFSLDSGKKKKKRIKKKIEKCYFKKKICLESNENKVFSQRSEEMEKKSSLCLYPPSSNQISDSYKKKEQEIKSDCLNQYKNELKISKYAKYIEEEENENNLEVVKKITNVFDSNTTDLDSLLNI